VARERGGYGIWVDTDGYLSLPGIQDVVLTSVIKVMDLTMYELVMGAYEGNYEGCSYYVGELANGGVGIAPYHDLESEVPAELAAEVEALKAQIISGEITDTGCLSYPEWCPSTLYGTE
jgi:basic membrane protein A